MIVNAFLYYVMDNPIISDGEYDKLSQIAADGWDQLTKDRQWALRDPASTRSGGSHIRFSTLAVYAAYDAHNVHFGHYPDKDYSPHWTWSKERKTHYVTALS